MKELPCIVCPNGCRLRVEKAADGALTISGNLCDRGAAFARAEITNPVRVLTTTVRTVFTGVPALPVRTAGEIPKGKIREMMRLLKTLTVDRPLGIGEAAVKNALGLGVDVIVTSAVLQEAAGEKTT